MELLFENSFHAVIYNVMQWSVEYILTADNSKEAYDIAIIGTLKNDSILLQSSWHTFNIRILLGNYIFSCKHFFFKTIEQ